MSDGYDNDGADLGWENRVLCGDESCIGTIGPDGRCRDCGRRYEGTLPWMSGNDQSDEISATDSVNKDAVGDSHDPSNDENPEDGDLSEDEKTGSADDEWERRTLCVDESCIGVIGPDGRCKECGRSS